MGASWAVVGRGAYVTGEGGSVVRHGVRPMLRPAVRGRRNETSKVSSLGVDVYCIGRARDLRRPLILMVFRNSVRWLSRAHYRRPPCAFGHPCSWWQPEMGSSCGWVRSVA